MGRRAIQLTSEVFYRFHLTPFLAITPDVQLIVDSELRQHCRPALPSRRRNMRRSSSMRSTARNISED
ncbi:MAG: carbohydrate porin [Planctomycetes bacterium]|nr:carbohydrate porin [Planctomycetota bacterium]MCH9725148.1 carbohydrate porin [Planctomycetota bacterium]MCH9774891.1 carbohydrate porin [Planctomycetota bacterium]